MKILRNIMLCLLILVSATAIVLSVIYKINTAAVSDSDDSKIIVEIPSGSSAKDIAKILKKNDLIKSEDFFIFYLKLHKRNSLKASVYELDKTMKLSEIITVLEEGNSYNPNSISITFVEGINIRKIAKIISANTNNKEEDVFTLLKDTEYIKSLISEYWFLTDEIKNKDIYYPLEGYLFPAKYDFVNKEVTVKDIFKAMLNKMDKELTKYKADIEKSSFTIHQMLTLSSIVELEGVSDDTRKDIASVFYNRLARGMSLGSDVTTYYAIKVDMNERDLYKAEIDAYNPYNTRGPNMAGKLPVGPVCISGTSSIEASIVPNKTEYLYFVADKYKKVFFTKTYSEHTAKVKEIKDKGDWIQW